MENVTPAELHGVGRHEVESLAQVLRDVEHVVASAVVLLLLILVLVVARLLALLVLVAGRRPGGEQRPLCPGLVENKRVDRGLGLHHLPGLARVCGNEVALLGADDHDGVRPLLRRALDDALDHHVHVAAARLTGGGVQGRLQLLGDLGPLLPLVGAAVESPLRRLHQHRALVGPQPLDVRDGAVKHDLLHCHFLACGFACLYAWHEANQGCSEDDI
mmetsp:Transcript_13638/g.38727  ORF Transcript_13638/g.38727 Transcript_13638/m.38727 type:complete len:217 (+) Transcript_13638:2150-2800(+)